MRSRVRSRLALGAVVASTLGLSACGGLPAGAVVDVDGTAVSKQTFDREVRWLAFQAQGGAQILDQKNVPFIVPDPPNYERCTKQLGPLAKQQGGQEIPADQLKQQCKQFYEQVRDTAMQQVIVGEWSRGEARDQDVEISDADLRKRFDREVVGQQFQGRQKFDKALELTNFTREQALSDFRTQALFEKLQENALKGKDRVSPEEARKFYDGNARQFTQPAKRDLEIVLTDKKADAERAASQIRDGRSFAAVAKDLSTDQATKDDGGKLAGATAEQLDRSLAKEVFAAKDGALVGPTQTSFGWYVVRAGKKTDEKKQSFEEVRSRLVQQLGQQKQQKAAQDWEKGVIARWSKKTECREGLAVYQLCENGPAKPPQQPGQPGAAGGGAAAEPTSPAQGGDPTGGAPADPSAGGGASSGGGSGSGG